MKDSKPELITPPQLRYRYRYEKLLGEGSNGKTYLAHSLSSGEAVAIKALKRFQRNDFKSFELFKREAETLSSIHVHGVPRFYESIFSDEQNFYASLFSEAQTGENFIIQEFISAPSLQSYLDEKRKFSDYETLIMMSKIAKILYSLHSLYTPPIIHRDIKPANILCTLPTNDDWLGIDPYLIDFGAVANAHSSDRSTIAGTVGYMAPEQNLGECLPQSDFYALGATAIHMLTGKAPYNMEFETYSLKIDKELAENAPQTSQNMKQLLESLLSYNHDKRPQNAQVLQEMIDNVLNHRAPDKNAQTTKVNRFFDRVRTIAENIFRSNQDWSQEKTKYQKTTGYIQTIADGFIQFTFDANGMSWIGRAANPFYERCDEGYFMFRNIKPHTPCIVSYHPNHPAACMLVSIPDKSLGTIVDN